MNPRFSKWTEDNVAICRYLHENAREVFLELVLRIAEQGIYIRLTSGHRTAEEQKKEYDEGDSWVLCPDSYHCHGLAVDIVPMERVSDLLYRAIWGKDAWERGVYEKMAKVAYKLGIAWGYQEWGVDRGHFHYRDNKTIYQIAEGNFPKKPEIAQIPYHRETRRVIDRLQNRDIITPTLFPYLYGSS
jgi:hypothetical protein